MARVEKYAWIPVYIKSPHMIIWLHSYYVQKTNGLPVLCDCLNMNCEHQKCDEYFKVPIGDGFRFYF